MGRVLLTGSTGFVGRRVAARLLDAGYEVVALVRDTSRCPEGCVAVQANLSVAKSLRRVTDAAGGCTALLHLAAAIPRSSLGDDPLPAMRAANVDTTRALMTALPASIRHVVYASTLDVYGPPSAAVITEDHPTNPTTAYGRSKLEAESLLTDLCTARGLALTCLRLTQVYGPDEPPTKAIPRFIQMIASGDAPVLFGDGSELRTYVYVDDAAEAFVRAVTAAVPGVFNIAGAEPISIAETLQAIIDVSGKQLSPALEGRVKPKIDMVLSTARAQSTLGFTARVRMRDGLRRHYEAHVAAEPGR